MSMFKSPKMPAVPTPPPAPTSEEQTTAQMNAAEETQTAWLRLRRAAETNVGGKTIAEEEQAGRGLLKQKQRSEARRTMGLLSGSRG